MRLVQACVVLAIAGSTEVTAQGTPEFARADSATVRLAPSAFPQLPDGVRRDLERRKCKIPQTYLRNGPHNVIRGAFTARDRDDWAVLCSVAGVSRILVYSSMGSNDHSPGAVEVTDSLGAHPDRDYLQSGVQIGVAGGIGFSRMIAVAKPPAVQRLAKAFGDTTIVVSSLDHAGVEDSFLEKAFQIFYRRGEKWFALQGSD